MGRGEMASVRFDWNGDLMKDLKLVDVHDGK
jgi:hypothetical protein